MSHFTKCKTDVTDKGLLVKALKHLGWKFEEGDFTITQYGTSEKAQIKFSNALGLQQQKDGSWSMVGDPYHHHGADGLNKYYRQEKKFAADLKTAYSVVEVKEKMEEQGFEAIDNSPGVVGKDGKIRMVFQKVMG